MKTASKKAYFTSAGTILALSLVVGGCNQKLTGVTTPTTALSSVNVNECTNTVVDHGQKGNVAAVGRGAFSDTKIYPNTSYPTTAYVDTGAVSIKYAWWNGSSFVTEVIGSEANIAATVNVTGLRMAYLSTGIPIVAWTETTQTSTVSSYLKVAMRNTSPYASSAPSWTVAIVDSMPTTANAAGGAIEMSVNPKNQVLLAYYWGGAATLRPKVALCDTPCTSPSSFAGMGAANFVDATGGVAGAVQLGAAWCNMGNSPNTYTPIITYTLAAATNIVTCTAGQTTLVSCLTTANWGPATASNKLQVTGASTILSTIYIDPTIVGDTIKILYKTTAATAPATMVSTSACDTSPFSSVALSAAATPTTFSATTGTSWMKILKDPNTSRFHIFGNDNNATPFIGYMNQTTGSGGAQFATNGDWNTWSTIEQVTTLSGSGMGGADVSQNTSYNYIYGSYGTTPASLDQNIRMGLVEDYTQPSSATSTYYDRFTVDDTGNIQLTTTATARRNISAASTSAGIPAVAYVDYSQGATGTGRLKYSLRSGTSSSSEWPVILVPNTISPQTPSLAFDQNNLPWIAYYDAGNTVPKFYLTTNSSSDGTGVWTTFESPYTSGTQLGLPVTNDIALAMYWSGGIAYPTIGIIESLAAQKGVKTAQFNPATGAWTYVLASPFIDNSYTSGQSISMDSDKSGDMILGYYETASTKVKYTSRNSNGTWNSPLIISGASAIQGDVRVKLNPVTGAPSMVYLDATNNNLYYASCSGTAITCALSGWTLTVIDNAMNYNPAVAPYNLAAADIGLVSPSLFFDSYGNAYVSYMRGAGGANGGSLMLATNASGSWVTNVAVSGAASNLTSTPVLSFGAAGWDASSVYTSRGTITTLYVGPGDWLYSNSCGD